MHNVRTDDTETLSIRGFDFEVSGPNRCSRDFLDSRFRQNVDYKLRFEVLLICSLGFPYQQEGISKFPKNEIEVSLHPQDSLNWWESLPPSL